jgi:hypothetical protein
MLLVRAKNTSWRLRDARDVMWAMIRDVPRDHPLVGQFRVDP